MESLLRGHPLAALGGQRWERACVRRRGPGQRRQSRGAAAAPSPTPDENAAPHRFRVLERSNNNAVHQRTDLDGDARLVAGRMRW